MKPNDIIKYIVWYATQNDIRLTTNRLVKFLYLADIYQAKIKNGKTLTSFPWRFVYYGPYCREAWQSIENAAKKGIICKETYNSHFSDDKDFSIFSCEDDVAEKLEDGFHIGVLSQLQRAIKKLGDDTPQLLDYVYFETEPMKDAKKGDLLDFSKAKKPEPVKTIKFKKMSPETIRLAREKIKSLGDDIKTSRDRLAHDEQLTEKYKDDSFYKFVKLLDGEDLEIGLAGITKIEAPE